MSLRAFLLACLVMGSLAAATRAADERPRPIVVTTNTILADMTREITGDAAEVRCLVPAGTDLHGFDPTPRDIAPLLEADLVVANGAGFEPWLGRFLAASGYSGPVVQASDSCALLTAEAENAPDEHHGHDGAHDHDTAHDHGAFDPHAWQDPRLALRYVANIRDALVQAHPSGAESYRRRARLYAAQIETLDAWARRLFSLLPQDRRVLVTSHDSLAYFGRTYGLEIVPLRGVDARTEPDAKQLAATVDLLRSRRARALFVEAVSNPRLLEQLARDTGVAIGGELFTDSLGPTGSPAASYLGMVRENTLRILAALEAASP
ncbi:MAG: zinc ABC transporter substrate-binding protein [Opitutaceae bacterium]|nr:zinc ABC transporter substrate-binding protein [Opitutaceae bacterium]